MDQFELDLFRQIYNKYPKKLQGVMGYDFDTATLELDAAYDTDGDNEIEVSSKTITIHTEYKKTTFYVPTRGIFSIMVNTTDEDDIIISEEVIL